MFTQLSLVYFPVSGQHKKGLKAKALAGFYICGFISDELRF